MQRADSSEKTDAGRDWRGEEEETTEDEMVRRHLWFNAHEFEQAPGDGEGQEPGVLQSIGLQRVGQDWATEQQEWLIYNVEF